MKTSFLIGCLMMIATVAAPAASPFAGTWEGKVNDLPGVALTVKHEQGKVNGTITFYLQMRQDEQSKWEVKGGNPTPLLTPELNGKTLTFEVAHRKSHGSSEWGPNVPFRVEFVNADEARLHKLDEGAGGGEGLKLLRRK